MKRFRIVLFIACFLAVLSAGVISFHLAGQRTPTFYAEAIEQTQPPAIRQQAAREFVRETVRLAEEIRHAPEWSAEFTDKQVNAWLSEELPQNFPEVIPPGVRDPRIKFEADRILVGFRYDGVRTDERWRGVISVVVEPSVPDSGRLSIRILSAKAGLLPIPVHKSLEELTSNLHLSDWSVEWQTENGIDVLLVDISRARDQLLEAIERANHNGVKESRPETQGQDEELRADRSGIPTGPNDAQLEVNASLESIELGEGTLRIAGRRLDPKNRDSTSDEPDGARVTQR